MITPAQMELRHEASELITRLEMNRALLDGYREVQQERVSQFYLLDNPRVMGRKDEHIGMRIEELLKTIEIQELELEVYDRAGAVLHKYVVINNEEMN